MDPRLLSYMSQISYLEIRKKVLRLSYQPLQFHSLLLGNQCLKLLQSQKVMVRIFESRYHRLSISVSTFIHPSDLVVE